MRFKKFRQFLGSQTSVGMAGILQNLQNVIVAVICLMLFVIMISQIYWTSLEVFKVKNFRDIAANLIYIFVLIELFRLMIYYLEEQRIRLGTIIEVAIVSVLREIIMEGIIVLSWDRILVSCALLLTLTFALLINYRLEEGIEKLEQITLEKPGRPRERE